MTETALAAPERIRELLPTINLDDARAVSDYGKGTLGAQSHRGVLEHLENSPIAALASIMQKVLLATQRPEVKKQTRKWWQVPLLASLTGGDIEEEINVLHSRAHLPANLDQANGLVERIELFLAEADALQDTLRREAAEIEALVQAGRQFLAANPKAGMPKPGETEFINQRDRFERRLQNLDTLFVSHQMSIAQIRLAQAQAVDILDRFRELRDVLIPVYRQHQLATANQRFLDPEVARIAVKAHESIQKSVERSLRGLPAAQA